ncbi:nuclear transport factor 2 family protein [Streptomyces sp. NPDC048111]|uniref:nuclear transport factor 2 family protein n=1 Tax=Streptomyces sp. NPDC048111 TaxID=3365500 RepID=UPI003720A2F3
MTLAGHVTAVSNLIARYAELVDTGDFAAVGGLFRYGAFVGRGEPARGAEAVERMLRDTVVVYEDGTPRTHHVTSNLAVEVDEQEGTATARSYVTVFQALPGLALQPVAAGRYQDRFQLRDGSWWFGERRVTVHLVGDVSGHLMS